ncbi:hypothetical protein [Brevibacillus dissolubilis]|uniref:hypothetical protein n=1 Tax=Brevibacillus dissolubilis TaxID=1844116 RepID=UPI0011171642|nr:hypothetical protein [Brevibacillus dissolubilis]
MEQFGMLNVMTSLEQNATQLNQMLSGSNQPYAAPILSVANDVSQMLPQLSGMNPNRQQVDQLRQQITDMRMAIQQAHNDILQAEEAPLQTYRDSLGQQKDEFEGASAFAQPGMNATAYDALQTFRQSRKLLDCLDQFNSDLMSLSQGLEHQVQPQGKTPSTTNSDFEHDPAPVLPD